MNWLHWYDWLTPTTPLAALFFGIMSTFIVSIGLWITTKKWKIVLFGFVSGFLTSLIGVLFLNIAGFY